MTADVTATEIAHQLHEEFRHLDIGARVPSEQALADRFELGRGIIHSIMGGFERRGLVRRERGAGTRWIGRDEYADDARSVPSFSSAVRAAGRTPGYRVVSVGSHRAVKSEQELLGLHANSLVWRVQRVLCIDDAPVGFATSVLPFRRLPAWPGEFDAYGSIFDTLSRRYGVASSRRWKRNRRVGVPAFVGRALGLAGPVPLRLAESLNVTPDGTPIEFARSYMRADRLGLDALCGATATRNP